MGHRTDSGLNERLIGGSRQPGGEWVLLSGMGGTITCCGVREVTEAGGHYEIL